MPRNGLSPALLPAARGSGHPLILMRAERGHTGPLEIDVIEKNGALEGRFKLLFPGCTYKVTEFQEYIKDLANT